MKRYDLKSERVNYCILWKTEMREAPSGDFVKVSELRQLLEDKRHPFKIMILASEMERENLIDELLAELEEEKK